jgi:hypothetical protein
VSLYGNTCCCDDCDRREKLCGDDGGGGEKLCGDDCGRDDCGDIGLSNISDSPMFCDWKLDTSELYDGDDGDGGCDGSK